MTPGLDLRGVASPGDCVLLQLNGIHPSRIGVVREQLELTARRLGVTFLVCDGASVEVVGVETRVGASQPVGA